MGIHNGLTNSYSSYQNGITERKNHLLQEKAQGLLLHANVPLIFWPEAIRLDAALINWDPSRVSGWKTPMDVWHGEARKRPGFHVFGCLVHAVIPEELRISRLEEKTGSGAYLGSSSQRARHRIVSFEPPLVSDCSQFQFVEDRLYFWELDVNLAKWKYHNKPPSGSLPGIKRPKLLIKKGNRDAEFETLKVKDIWHA